MFLDVIMNNMIYKAILVTPNHILIQIYRHQLCVIFCNMKLFIAVCVALLGYAVAQEQYSTEDFDIEEVLSNERLLKGYSKCLLDKGPCTPEVKRFKDKIPEVLETKCAKCTERQKEMGKQLANEMKKRYPEMWTELVAKYDAEGKFQAAFKEYLSKP